jgi:O-antigen ligase
LQKKRSYAPLFSFGCPHVFASVGYGERMNSAQHQRLRNTRYIAGAICIVLAWVFPFYTPVSRDAMGQIFALAMLSAATLLYGLRPVHPRLLAALIFILALLVITPAPYPIGKATGLVWGALLLMGCSSGARMLSDKAARAWFMGAVLAAAVLSAMEGVLQWLGLSAPLWPWVDEPEIRGVAYGAFRQTNLFATFLVCGMIAVFWAVCTQKMTKPMAWALALLLSVGVAASGSRTGFAHVLVLSIAAWIWRRRLPAGVPWLIMGQIVAVALTYPTLTWLAKVIGFPVYTAVDSMFNSERLALWSNVVALVLERPWLGWGRSELVYAQYITVVQTRYPEILSHSHNLLLQTAFEFGVPLVIAAIGLMLWAIWRTTPWRDQKSGLTGTVAPHWDRLAACAFIIVIAGIHAMLEFPLSYAGFIYLLGVSIGSLYAATDSNSDASFKEKVHHLWVPRAVAVLAMGLIVFAYQAWGQLALVRAIQDAPFNDRAAQRLAIANASGAWLFKAEVEYAELVTMEITPESAAEVRRRAQRLLHVSVAPAIVQRLLISLWLTNDQEAFVYHAERYCRSNSKSFLEWLANAATDGMKLKLQSLTCA